MCPEVNDTLLIQYLDNSADAWVAAHVVHCLSCRERVAALAHAEDGLRTLLQPAANERQPCPSQIELGDYYLDMLDVEHSFDLSLHLQGCASCRERLQALSRFVDDAMQPRTIVYPYLGAATVGQAAAFRDGVTARTNEFTYRLEEAEINLSVQNSDAGAKQHTIWGLVTGIEPDRLLSAELIASGSGDSLYTTPVNALGDFVLTDIPMGHYELLINGTDVAYVLRGIAL